MVEPPHCQNGFIVPQSSAVNIQKYLSCHHLDFTNIICPLRTHESVETHNRKFITVAQRTLHKSSTSGETGSIDAPLKLRILRRNNTVFSWSMDDASATFKTLKFQYTNEFIVLMAYHTPYSNPVHAANNQGLVTAFTFLFKIPTKTAGTNFIEIHASKSLLHVCPLKGKLNQHVPQILGTLFGYKYLAIHCMNIYVYIIIWQ